MSFSIADVPYYSSRDGDDDGASTDGSTGSGWSSSSKVGRAVSGGRRGQQGAFPLGREARAVRLWRAAVIASLVVGTVAITAAMWFLLSQQDESTYQAAYAVVTRTVEARATEQVLKLHEAMIALGEVFTATAIAENMTWPFVTVTREPFEVLGHDARRESGAEFTFVVPFVAEAQRKEWLQYSADNIGWYEQGKVVDGMLSSSSERRAYIEGNISQDFFTRLGPAPVLNGTTKHAPVWQSTPPPYIPGVVNYDIVHENYFENTIAEMEGARAPTGLFSDVFNLTGGSALAGSAEYHQRYHQAFSSSPVPVNETDARPHGIFIVPIFEAYQDTASKLVGVVGSLLAWDRYMVNLVPESVTGILVVLENSCNQSYSFVLNGTKAQYLGAGAFLNLTFPESRYSVSLDVSDRASRASGSSSESRDRTDFGNCVYSLQLYSTSEFKNSVATDTAFVFTLVAACVGTMVIATFLLYDCYVRRRNSKMVDAAARRDQLLTNLIPTTVRTRLLEEQDHAEKNCPSSGGVMVHHRLRNFLSGKDGKDEHEAAEKPVSGSIASEGYEGRPIADLFPEATILCADISGFTAWASVRQPSQVFTLLESIFKEFDTMANKRKVFKVETVGDCYVAVAGLPDPRKDHAVVMARFANDCLNKMIKVVEVLEVSLGPDTADLSLRVGIHSGPVTAGMLRGDRSRFQLFGDTMSTASRMESTGVKGRIQCSQDTADLLIAAGKEQWLEPRRSKSGIQTYFLNTSAGSSTSGHVEMIGGSHFGGNPKDKNRRLVNWNVDNLLQLLKHVAATRNSKPGRRSKVWFDETKVAQEQAGPGKTVINEVKEIINLPDYKTGNRAVTAKVESIVLPQIVVDQLRKYVTNIAALYIANPFHNFEHASHVAMAVSKLLSRIVAPADMDPEDSLSEIGKVLHDHTYGITSDPLTQFACVFSALIHDVDHLGVPNAQLVKEKVDVAVRYKNKSVAEQNSVDVAWSLLMEPDYDELRKTIYTTEGEMRRFRQLVVNSVMATDIVDRNLKVLRNARWAKAFSDDATVLEGWEVAAGDETEASCTNRKATIVIEHVIQAADVSHTMQHWHVYRKWNERFFEECYKAYAEGRAETDPSVGWYQGELGFYDFYIIPLARKLKDCGVFGVSSDECLNYAVRNREEWEEKGQSIVSEMIERTRGQYPFVTQRVDI